MSLLLLPLLIGCGGSGSDPGVSEGVSEGEAEPPQALDDQAYRFCHLAGFEKSEASDYCALLAEAPPEVCPGMRESCTTDVEERRSGGCNDDGAGQGDDRVPAEVPERPDLEEPYDADLEWLGEVARWVMALLVAVLVLVVLRILVGWFGWRRERPDAPIVEGVQVVADPDDPLPDVPDLPSDDLLDQARSALERGDAGAAVVLARGASLRALGERGVLRLHRSRTDREYVRQLRGDEQGQADLRVVVAAVETHVWGGRPVALSLARLALDAAVRLVAAACLVWLLMGVARPALAQTPERYGPDGDAALFDVFQMHGYDVSWRLTPLADIGEETDALVLDAVGVLPDQEQWDALRAWVEQGGVLLVGGDATVAFPELGAWTPVDETVRSVALAPLRQGGVPSPRFSAGPWGAWTGGLGEPWATLEGDEDAWVVQVLDVGAGVVISVSDDRLFMNGSLVHPDNERFLGDVLYSGQGRFGWPLPTPARVQLATRIAASGSGSGNPASSLANARLLPMVLQLLVVWVLAGLWRGWPFGALRDPPSEGRQAFSEHIEALGTRYFRLGATRLVLVRTAQLWLARMGPTGLQLAAQRAGRSQEEAARWVHELEAVAAAPEGPDDPGDLERVEELWTITRTQVP